MLKNFLILNFLITLSGQAASTAEYTKKWNQLHQQANNAVTNLKPTFSWVDDGIIFKKETLAEGAGDLTWKFILTDRTNGQSVEAFDHSAIASELQEILGKKIHAQRLPLQDIQISNKSLSFRIGKLKFHQINGKLTKSNPNKDTKSKPKDTSTGVSPNGKWQAFIKDGKLYLKNLESDTPEIQIGTPRKKESYYTNPIKWNSVSSHFIAHQVTPGQRRTITLVESSPKDQLQPKLHTLRYDKPGDKIDIIEPHIFSADGKTQHSPDHGPIQNPFSLGKAHWTSDGTTMLYEYVERGFGKHYLISMDAHTGKQRILVKEESNTFIYVNSIRFRKDLTENNEIIWGSQRDGWRHLYLLDSKTGAVKNRITQGKWIVRKIIEIDTQKRQIIFTASGKNDGEDPYHIHWYRVNFDGSQLTPLTQGDGTHQLEFSPDKKYYIDTWSRIDHPPVYELRRSADGQLVTELLRADASALPRYGMRMPERFHCKDRNGRFDIWGMILTPPNYDPSKKYPIIEYIYAGPHGAFVPKAFKASYGLMSECATEGFIVVKIDGLGTNYRHKDFSHFCYKNLVDSGLPDRIKWIKAAASTRSYMDTSRVGIFGGSAGGQSSTAALLHHGHFYKAAASDCGCHDNRMDKIWWNEQWMDWPIGPHYKQQSNITNADKLQGALMLTVGELDKNVDPSSTTQLVDALIKVDKDFDYYLIPGRGHGSGDIPSMRRKRLKFFTKHLGGPK